LFAGRPQADVDAFLEATDTTDLDTAIRVYLNGLEGQFNVLIAQIGGKVLPGLYAVAGDALEIAVSGTPGGERPASLAGGAQLTRVR
jgi:hypothetical protein